MSMSDNISNIFLSTWNGICAFIAKVMEPIRTLLTERPSSGCSFEQSAIYTGICLKYQN